MQSKRKLASYYMEDALEKKSIWVNKQTKP